MLRSPGSNLLTVMIEIAMVARARINVELYSPFRKTKAALSAVGGGNCVEFMLQCRC